jgi:N-terminal half of MaoC dehydratase
VTSAEVYITPEMRSIIGRPLQEVLSYPVSTSDIRKWAIAIYYPEVPPRLYWDEAYSATTPFGGIVAPEDFNPFAWATVEPELAPRREVLELDWNYLETQQGIDGPGLNTMLNGGSQTRYGVRIRPGDVIRCTSHVRSYTEKQGRTATLLLTVIRSIWTNQRGEMVKEADRTSIRY